MKETKMKKLIAQRNKLAAMVVIVDLMERNGVTIDEVISFKNNEEKLDSQHQSTQAGPKGAVVKVFNKEELELFSKFPLIRYYAKGIADAKSQTSIEADSVKNRVNFSNVHEELVRSTAQSIKDLFTFAPALSPNPVMHQVTLADRFLREMSAKTRTNSHGNCLRSISDKHRNNIGISLKAVTRTKEQIASTNNKRLITSLQRMEKGAPTLVAAQPVSVYGVFYKSMSAAARVFKTTAVVVGRRCASERPSFSEWKFLPFGTKQLMPVKTETQVF